MKGDIGVLSSAGSQTEFENAFDTKRPVTGRDNSEVSTREVSDNDHRTHFPKVSRQNQSI